MKRFQEWLKSKSQAKQRSQHIVRVKKNTSGDDKIIGDVHGNLSGLKKAIGSLGEHGRLFIVGDLVDRGEDSLGVIRAIVRQNEIRPGSVQAIRGNHEDMFLDFYHAVFGSGVSESTRLTAIANVIRNGGEWLLSKPEDKKHLQELIQNYHQKIANIPGNLPEDEKRNLKKTYSDELNDELMRFAATLDKKSFISQTDLAEIADYMTQLPYIIDVGDDTGFLVCHATLPISDAQLANRTDLADSEIQECTWHRKNKARLPRELSDKVVYVGHNTLENSEEAVDEQANTVDLDISNNHSLLMVNHSKKQLEIRSPSDAAELQGVQSKIDGHLIKQAHAQLEKKIHTLDPADQKDFIEALTALQTASGKQPVDLEKIRGGYAEFDAILTAYTDFQKNMRTTPQQRIEHLQQAMAQLPKNVTFDFLEDLKVKVISKFAATPTPQKTALPSTIPQDIEKQKEMIAALKQQVAAERVARQKPGSPKEDSSDKKEEKSQQTFGG